MAAVAAFAFCARCRCVETRRRVELSTPPIGVTIMTIVHHRGRRAASRARSATGNGSTPGVPWVVPFVLLVILGWSVVLGRSRLGRYIYAIGANPEAARRAGINVALRPDDRVRDVGVTAGSRRHGVRVSARARSRLTSTAATTCCSPWPRP